MSIYAAMFAGVAGLKANSAALGAISDNIANVNTVGYKRTETAFSTLVTSNEAIGQFSPGGVKANPRSLIEQQGLLLGSNSSTDLAIDGAGFFVVSPNPTSGSATDEYLFTRSGSFTTDAEGYLRNSAGYYLQGWPIDANGNVNPNPSDLSLLENINLEQLGGTAEQTTQMDLNANLLASQAVSPAEATYAPGTSANNMASGNVTPDFQREVQIFDSKGGFRSITFSFLKSSVPNEWHAEIHVSPSSDVTTGAGLVDGQIATGTLAFTSTGLLDTANTTLPTTLDFLDSGTAPGAGQVAWASSLGISGQSIDLNLGQANAAGGFTQFDAPSSLISSQVNGAIFGTVSGVNVSSDGLVTAVFDNGIQRDIYQLPIATFTNPNQLIAEPGNAYRVTTQSGPFNLKLPGIAGAGGIASSQLEASTVDLAEEFTGLITTQRAYSATTKIITTSDEMLDELIRIKR